MTTMVALLLLLLHRALAFGANKPIRQEMS
jgi:hypothetical protein